MSDLSIQSQPTLSAPKANSVKLNSVAEGAGGGQSLPNKAANNAVSTNAVLTGSVSTADQGSNSVNAVASDRFEDTGSAQFTANNSSNIMTYRDSDSGRLVVRVVDENNNAVISEFPSKTMLGNYPKAVSSNPTPGIDTKA